MTIRLAGVVKESIVDGPGIRYVVFTQGCPHRCPGCHNPETHDMRGGYEVSIDSLINEIKENPLLAGVTLSGGDPFAQAKACAEIAKRAKAIHLNVITYTGYTFEYLLNNANMENGWRDLLEQSTFLVDGPFIQDKKTLSLPYRGSTNQRVLDLRASLTEKRAIEANI